MRLDNGTSFDYAYSHVNARNTEFAFDPNEVGQRGSTQTGAEAGSVGLSGRASTTTGMLAWFNCSTDDPQLNDYSSNCVRRWRSSCLRRATQTPAW